MRRINGRVVKRGGGMLFECAVFWAPGWTFFQGNLFPRPGGAAVDEVVEPSAVCGGYFAGEDGGGWREFVDDLEAAYQRRWN
jgi:hypothetical protein